MILYNKLISQTLLVYIALNFFPMQMKSSYGPVCIAEYVEKEFLKNNTLKLASTVL